MPEDTEQDKYIKFSVSLREDIYERLQQLMKDTGLGRSGVISLALARLETKKEEQERKKSGSDRA
jgi:metal-responsive CopG/Arc/MetJ family transcriptional regulator